MVGQWLKTMVGSLCVMMLLMQLLPQGKFAKYVRFYAGLLLLLIAVRPALQLLAGEGELERLLQLEFLKEEYYDMETSLEGMDELKNSRIAGAYQSELHRQILDLASYCGAEVTEVRLLFDGENEYQIRKIVLDVDASQAQSTALEGLRREIAQLYQVRMEDIVTEERRRMG